VLLNDYLLITELLIPITVFQQLEPHPEIEPPQIEAAKIANIIRVLPCDFQKSQIEAAQKVENETIEPMGLYMLKYGTRF